LILTVNGQIEPTNGLQFKLIDKDYNWTNIQDRIDSFYYNLTPIQSSKQQKHIRILIPGTTIDLFTKDNTYEGFLINKAVEYTYEKQKNSEHKKSVEKQVVFEKIPLNEQKVKQIVELLINRQIQIPTDSLIPNWHMWFLDCNSIYFFYKIDDFVKTQRYLCLHGQKDTVDYKSIIAENYNLIKSTFDIDSLSIVFENNLPKGKTYSRDGFMLMYKMTTKQSEQWAKGKPMRNYLKSIKDTVDNYIKNELSKQTIETEGIRCFKAYNLTFGTNGKLKKVTLSKYAIPKLRKSFGVSDFFEEKREVRKCKSKIKSIFREIDLSFMNLEYEFNRTFTFDYKGDYLFYDRTIY
jgi:hypothetical protein